MTDDTRTHRSTAPSRVPAESALDDIAPFDEGIEYEQPDGVMRERMIARARVLWTRRGLVCRVTLGGIAVAIAAALLIPERYASTARLMPPDSQSGSGAAMLAAMSGSAGLSALAGNLLGVKGTGALFVGVLGSRTIQDRLIERFDLMAVYGASRLDDARQGLAGRTNVSEDRKSGIVTITVEDNDPERATAMARAYVDELDRLVVELTTSQANRERLFLEERLRTVKDDLDFAAREFSQFASDNATLDIRDQGRAMVDAAATLQGQLIAAQTELEGLRQVYADNNVRVRSLQARVDELRHQLDRMGGLGAPATERDGVALYPTLRELPLLGVTYADLYRRTRVQETVFELLTQQYELAKVQEVKEIPSVRILDHPVVPEKKSFPPRTLIVLAGMLLAFGTSVAWVLGRAYWDGMDENDPGRQFAQEVFSTLRADTSRLTAAACLSRTRPRSDTTSVPEGSRTAADATSDSSRQHPRAAEVAQA
jgi:uncharacterized protein involved in exopolysaccharide biosynthesis